MAAAADLDAAYALVREAMCRELVASCCVLEWSGVSWTARTELPPDSPAADFAARRDPLADPGPGLIVHRGPHGAATILPLNIAGPVVVVLDGDWSWLREPLVAGAALLSLALQVVRERAIRHEAAQLLVDGYALIRRLSRLGSVDAVAGAVVREVAALLQAERVSLALYDPGDASLTIVATEGLPLTAVKGVRIRPGDWVVGHVFASRRPVFVPDVRLLPGLAANSTKYRTFSFGAVPMLAGPNAVGVITVTDKRGNGAFTRQDELVLRTLSAAAAVALVAARTGDEVTRLSYAATIDSLTGLLNRPGLDSRLHQEVERAKRQSGHLAVLMADVDDFKTINDTRGHQVGDTVLRHVGAVIRSSVRVFDLCARYGGDEFCVVMPNSDLDSAILCAERIRLRLAERTADHELPPLSMSIGVAVIAAGESAGDLILRADQCLYRAKADGKNLVRAQPPPAETLTEMAASGHPLDDAAPMALVADAALRCGDLVSRDGQSELRYVLVVDGNAERVAHCLDAVAPFRVGFLVTQDGPQADGIIARFGAPLLMLVDLALPANTGLQLIDSLRTRYRGGSEVIAWSSSRQMREYASATLGASDVHVIAGAASPATIRGAIAHCLERQVEGKTTSAPTPMPTLSPSGAWDTDRLQGVMSALADTAKLVVTTPGVAVYMRAPGDRRYRESFSWNADDLIPSSPSYLPKAFEAVTIHGRAFITKDVTVAPAAGPGDADDAVRGLAAFPVVSAGEVLGALCIFDVVPLQITETQITALTQLGRLDSGGEVPASDERREPPSAGTSATAEIDRRSIPVMPPAPFDWPPALLERIGGEFAAARELSRARREGRELSIIVFEIAPLVADLDLGESVQDASDTLIRTIRQSDVPIRWSGHEFLVVLPGLTGERARSVAERVRAALQAGMRHRVAVAGGVAELEESEGFGQVVSRARERVSRARDGSHNRIF